MKTKSKNKQGISLIVLVITIIVMIILAAAIILSLSSNGIIDRANEAVDKTDLKQIQTLASTLWADAYLDEKRGGELEAAVLRGLEKIDTTNYLITVTNNGVSIDEAIRVAVTLYEGDTYPEDGGLLLGDKAIFNDYDIYRITMENENTTITFETKLVFVEGLYLVAWISNNKILPMYTQEEFMEKTNTIGENDLIIIGAQIFENDGSAICMLEFSDENVEYKISKIEKIYKFKYGEWQQGGTIVTNGIQTLHVGDYVNYEATGSDYEGTWQVLGAENGEILLVSSECVAEPDINVEAELEEVKNDWENIVSKLNTLCLPYGNGYMASTARSINGEDIDRIVRHHKEGWVANSSQITLNGDEVTYYWNGTEYPSYKSKYKQGKLKKSHSKFIWYDEASKSWKEAVNPGDEITEETPIKAPDGTIAKIKNNCVVYESQAVLSKTDPAYKLIFEMGNVTAYSLASTIVCADDEEVSHCIRVVFNYNDALVGVGAKPMVNSCGQTYQASGTTYHSFQPVRAVVSLQSDVVLKEGTDENSWVIANK